jgi:hypothetical protein
MLSAVVVFALIPVTALDEPPQPKKQPPSTDQLKAITERGRMIAEHDQAAWHASDAVQKIGIKEGSVEGYVALKTNKGWVVAFGRLKDQRGPYLIAYEAIQGKNPGEFQARAIDPPREDSGNFQAAARALQTAQDDFVKNFKGPERPYNFALVPAEKSQFWVYYMPAQTKPDVYPLGADVRYLISTDGAKVVEKRQLHKTVIENPPPKADGNQLVMGVHVHVLDDVPEDTDVFHVLRKDPPVPELIVTDAFVFAVEADGQIKYQGRREEVLKKKD